MQDPILRAEGISETRVRASARSQLSIGRA
jgi:hypothetical protein